MSIRKISEFVEASSPQNSDKLLIERNGSGKSITVGNLLNDVVTRTRVNLLRSSMPTKTSYGITCTNNGDGTFTINGTAAGNAVFTLAYVGSMSGGKLTGCPTNNSGSYLAILRGGEVWENVIMDRGTGAEITSLNTERNPVVIAIEQGLTMNNVVFKPMITNDLSATYDDFVSYDDSFITGINSGVKLDLLWTNASIDSNFLSQSIYLDLSNYKFVYIVLGFAGRASENTYPCLIKRSNEVRMPLFGSASFYYRPIGVRNNSIAFGDCEEVTIYNDKHTISNTACIPFEIYGVK